MHVTRFAVAACWLAAAGCSPSSHGASVSCMPPECPTDSTLLLVAEVDPPSDSLLVRQEFDSVSIDQQSGLFALTLSAQVTLSGSVHISDGTAAKNVAATVVATRPSRIIGRPDVVYQTAVDPIDGTYVLVVSRSLDPSEKYTLRVTTTDPSLAPPKTLSVAAVADTTVDVAFEAPLKLPELHGTILDSLQQPLAGMQVQATTVPSATSAAVVVSTTTLTDASGAFSIRLVASPPDKVLLTATPTLLAPEHLPSLAQPIDTTKLGPTSALTTNLSMPPLPATVQVFYKISGTSTSGAQVAVTAATCVFTADVSDPHATDGTKATYRVTAMTSSIPQTLGQVTVDLIPSDSGNRVYDVVVTPDPTQLFGSKETSINVGPPGYGPAIELALRSQLSGLIIDPDGKPLRNAMVLPAPATLAATLGPTALAVATPQQANASADGRFSLRLDAGFWDVGLIPPADAMLPRLWLSQLDLTGDLDVGTVLVPRGVIVHGVVHDPSGAPLAHANVRLYTVTSGNTTCAPTDQQCLAPPRLRAEGSSGSDGIVSLILPSEPKP
ncbi:MAG: hypothetical protein JWM53_4116 [bacterium]|nr:hypothetical protein [bacterium]